MQLTQKITIALLTFSVAVTAQAGTAERRGYNKCVDRIEHKLRNQRPVVSPAFFVSKTDDKRFYFINASAWQAGEREPMRAECVTSLKGSRVLALQVEPGTFTNAPRGRVEIEAAGD